MLQFYCVMFTFDTFCQIFAAENTNLQNIEQKRKNLVKHSNYKMSGKCRCDSKPCAGGCPCSKAGVSLTIRIQAFVPFGR